jgi:hypothetical protein
MADQALDPTGSGSGCHPLIDWQACWSGGVLRSAWRWPAPPTPSTRTQSSRPPWRSGNGNKSLGKKSLGKKGFGNVILRALLSFRDRAPIIAYVKKIASLDLKIRRRKRAPFFHPDRVTENYGSPCTKSQTHTVYLHRHSRVPVLTGTQEWEFLWLRFWILYYFNVSYA